MFSMPLGFDPDFVTRRFAQNLWRWKHELPEEDVAAHLEYEDLAASQWSPEFERLMRNRLVMGAMRYGRLHDPAKPAFNRFLAMKAKLFWYFEEGNLEYLVDLANLALLEFEEGQHPKRHFAATDDKNHVEETR